MNRRSFLAGLAIAMFAPQSRAQAPSRVGVLNFGAAPGQGAPEELITRHLRALGYVE